MTLYNNFYIKKPCAKVNVIAVIVNNGEYFIGTNEVENPQIICPRIDMKSGEGYELCKSICNQKYHAEETACRLAGDKAKGGILILTGHSYCCDNCKKIIEEYGIKEVIII